MTCPHQHQTPPIGAALGRVLPNQQRMDVEEGKLHSLGVEMGHHEGEGSSHQEELRFSEGSDSFGRHTGTSMTRKTIGL